MALAFLFSLFNNLLTPQLGVLKGCLFGPHHVDKTLERDLLLINCPLDIQLYETFDLLQLILNLPYPIARQCLYSIQHESMLVSDSLNFYTPFTVQVSEFLLALLLHFKYLGLCLQVAVDLLLYIILQLIDSLPMVKTFLLQMRLQGRNLRVFIKYFLFL